MMNCPISVVDAFAEAPFQGNPAAVCRLPAGTTVSPAWMQSVAAEMKHSETAFVSPRPDGDWDLRWFTPQVEVDLCGHATLATAHALWEVPALAPRNTQRFHTRSGWLTCQRPPDKNGKRNTNGNGLEIAMDFPARRAIEAAPPDGLLAGLGITREQTRWVGRDVDDFLVELADEAAVRALRPDFATLSTVKTRGVIVTARATGYDFVSRFFAPQVGIPEDPVTGSAHCALAIYWAEKLGRNRLRAWQASARGGAVGVESCGDRVTLVGRAITVWRGDWLV